MTGMMGDISRSFLVGMFLRFSAPFGIDQNPIHTVLFLFDLDLRGRIAPHVGQSCLSGIVD
jgi:hypothetical protein